MPKAFPIEFRPDVVAVARKGEAPMSQIATDFGVSESCLHRWLNLADIEDGTRAGVTAIESAELREAITVRLRPLARAISPSHMDFVVLSLSAPGQRSRGTPTAGGSIASVCPRTPCRPRRCAVVPLSSAD